MGIEKEISKVLVDAKKRKIEVNSILAGDKEMNEMVEDLEKVTEGKDYTILEMDFGIENNNKQSIRIFKVNEESFLKAAYVINEDEPVIKVSDLMSNNNSTKKGLL